MGGSMATMSGAKNSSVFQENIDPTGGLLVSGDRGTIRLNYLVQLEEDKKPYFALASAPLSKKTSSPSTKTQTETPPPIREDSKTKLSEEIRNIYVLRLCNPSQKMTSYYSGSRGVLMLTVYSDATLSQELDHYGAELPPVFINETRFIDEWLKPVVQNIVSFGLLTRKSPLDASPSPTSSSFRSFDTLPVASIEEVHQSSQDARSTTSVSSPRIIESHAFSVVLSAPSSDGGGGPLTEYKKIHFTTRVEEKRQAGIDVNNLPINLIRFSGQFVEDKSEEIEVTNVKQITGSRWDRVPRIRLIGAETDSVLSLLGDATFEHHSGLYSEAFYRPITLKTSADS